MWRQVIDDDSGRTVLTVRNSDTGEVVRQIPAEEVLQVARSVSEGNLTLIEREVLHHDIIGRNCS